MLRKGYEKDILTYEIETYGGITMVYLEAGNFWGRVRQLCGVNQISLAEMSRRAGLSYGNITRQISEGVDPTKYQQIKAMADVLGTTTEYLVDGERADENRPAPEWMEFIGDVILLEEAQKQILKSLVAEFKVGNEKRYDLEQQLGVN